MPATNLAVLYDHRHAEAREFRQRAAHWDARIRGTLDGDITEIWQNDLSVAWKKKPQALAGLTERPALFLLERLSWDYGLRVVFEAEHESTGKGNWNHSIVRSGNSSLKRELEAAGAAWPVVLADQMLAAQTEVAKRDFMPSGAAMAARIDEPTKLHSWIIAPRAAA
jgi:hypothetical protein